MNFFSRILFFGTFSVEIFISLPLITLCNGIPVLLRSLYTVLLHKGINEIVLAFADLTELMQIFPQLNIETFTDDVQQGRKSVFRKKVVGFRRTIAERRNGDGCFAVARFRQLSYRTLGKIGLQKFTLNRPSKKMHRHLAPLFVYEPLGEVIFEW